MSFAKIASEGIGLYLIKEAAGGGFRRPTSTTVMNELEGMIDPAKLQGQIDAKMMRLQHLSNAAQGGALDPRGLANAQAMHAKELAEAKQLMDTLHNHNLSKHHAPYAALGEATPTHGASALNRLTAGRFGRPAAPQAPQVYREADYLRHMKGPMGAVKAEAAAVPGMLGGMGRWGKIGLGVGAAGLGLYGLNKLMSPSKPPEMERPIYG